MAVKTAPTANVIHCGFFTNYNLESKVTAGKTNYPNKIESGTLMLSKSLNYASSPGPSSGLGSLSFFTSATNSFAGLNAGI